MPPAITPPRRTDGGVRYIDLSVEVQAREPLGDLRSASRFKYDLSISGSALGVVFTF